MANSPQRLWAVHLDQTPLHSSQLVGDSPFLPIQLRQERGKHSPLQAIHLADGALRRQHKFEYAHINGRSPHISPSTYTSNLEFYHTQWQLNPTKGRKWQTAVHQLATPYSR